MSVLTEIVESITGKIAERTATKAAKQEAVNALQEEITVIDEELTLYGAARDKIQEAINEGDGVEPPPEDP